MKNLLNSITQEEKNRILEMHRIIKEQVIRSSDYGMTNLVKNREIRRDNTSVNPSDIGMGKYSMTNLGKPSGIKAVQQALIDKGYNVGKLGADGILGNDTRKAIIKYQKDNNIKQTGVVGPITAKSLGVQPLTSNKSTVKDIVNPEKTDKKQKTNVSKPEITNGFLDKNSSLLFDGDQLHWLSSGEKVKSWDAESGLTIKNALSTDSIMKYLKSFIQSKDEWMQEKNAGPIPTGSYIVGPLQTRNGDEPEIGAWEAFWLKISGQLTDDNQDFYVNTLKSRIGWGNHRLPITPEAGTNTYKRGSFYIHGGSLKGSHGCIDLTDSMDDFSKVFASWSSYSKKKKMRLKVEYKDTSLGLISSTLVKIDNDEPVDLNRIGVTNNNLA
jgi:peptidoglycan hydrolase-like protein with peptidoglycan-binding domain